MIAETWDDEFVLVPAVWWTNTRTFP